MHRVPIVSIVMPCFNAAAHLPRSVASVLAQTFVDWELIAVDDGSTDETLAWLRAQRDGRVVVLSQQNAGVSSARNSALARARAPLVAFLDADDTWEPDFLARMIGALVAAPEAVLSYCGWRNVGLAGARGEPFIPPDYEDGAKARALFSHCGWPIHAAVVRREAVLRAGGFDRTLRNAEDYALWLRVALSGRILRVPEVLALYHFHGVGQASSQRDRVALQFLQAQERALRDIAGLAEALGPQRPRQLTLGTLLDRGYDCYWQGDLRAARHIFRAVMRRGYGRPRDWMYMLPSLLPIPLHRALLTARRGSAQARKQTRGGDS